MDPEHPDYWHALIEAYRSMAWERDHCLYDPDTGPDLAMLDPEKLADRRNRIDPGAAGSWRRSVPAAGGTAYMCTVDGDGMGVSLIQSNFHGIGSGLSAGRTGVRLHNRGAGFNLTPGHPNEWIPGRRPLHTLSPTIWTEGNRLALVLGTRGGHQQPQLLAQMGAHLCTMPARTGRRPGRSPLDHPGHQHHRIHGLGGEPDQCRDRQRPARSWTPDQHRPLLGTRLGPDLGNLLITERSEGSSGGSSGRDRPCPEPLRRISSFSRGPGSGPWPTPHPLSRKRRLPSSSTRPGPAPPRNER